jgi:hypothetical protein
MAVDKKYIEAISNFADALEQLVEALNSKGTGGKTGDGSGSSGMADVKNTLTSISSSIDEIKSDTKEIKSSSSETLKIAKEIKANQSQGGMFGGDGEKSKTKSVMTGIGTILMIAGAVIAIGLAFKLVGGVDFASVIALSFAIVSIGYVFEKLSSIDNLNYTKVEMVSLSLVALSIAMVASSWILSMTSDVSGGQLMTLLGIGITFAIVGSSIGKLVETLSEIKFKDLIKLPITLVLISSAIYLSSIILNKVEPVSGDKLLTSIAISFTFAIIGYGVNAISKAVDNLSLVELLLLPLTMVLISGAIYLSSLILNKVEPVSPDKLYGTILLAGTLAITSILLALPLLIFGKIGIPTLLQGGAGLIIVAAAVSAAAMIFNLLPRSIFKKGGLLYDIADTMRYFMFNFAEVIAYGVEVIGPAIAKFIDLIEPPVSRFLTNIVPVLAEAIGNLVEKVLPPFGEFMETIISSVGKFIKDVMEGIFPAIKEMFGFLRSLVSEISPILDSVSNVFRSIGDVIESAGRGIKGVLEGVASVIRSPIDAISGLIGMIGNTIVKVVDGVATGLERMSNLDPKKSTESGKAMSALASGLVDIVAAIPWAKDMDETGRLFDSIANLGKYGKGLSYAAIGMKSLPSLLNSLLDLDTEKMGEMSVGVDKLAMSYTNLGTALASVVGSMNTIQGTGEVNYTIFSSSSGESGEVSTEAKISVTPIKEPKKETTTDGKTLDDLYNQMTTMNQQLSVISSGSINISEYISELRTKDTNIGIGH